MLGYFFGADALDRGAEELSSFLVEQRADRRRRLVEMIDRLTSLGVPIATDFMDGEEGERSHRSLGGRSSRRRSSMPVTCATSGRRSTNIWPTAARRSSRAEARRRAKSPGSSRARADSHRSPIPDESARRPRAGAR
jgi:hypothetical protein